MIFGLRRRSICVACKQHEPENNINMAVFFCVVLSFGAIKNYKVKGAKRAAQIAIDDSTEMEAFSCTKLIASLNVARAS